MKLFKLIDKDEGNPLVIQFTEEITEEQFKKVFNEIKWNCFDELLENLEKKLGKFNEADIFCIYY